MRIGLLLLFFYPFAGSSQSTIQQKAVKLIQFFTTQHYQPLTWNDSSTALFLTQWLREHDEEKLIFTQEDIALLQQLRKNLPEELEGKGWNFYPTALQLYKKRVLRTDSLVGSFLSKPVVLKTGETLQWPPADFAANEKERLQRWQLYLKWNLLKRTAAALPDSTTAATAISTFYHNNEPANREKLRKSMLQQLQNLTDSSSFVSRSDISFLNCLTWCYDPHSNYMDMVGKERFMAATSANEYSCGLQIATDGKAETIIAYIQPGSSAWRSGQLHKGDALISIKTSNQTYLATDLDEEELNELLTGSNLEDVEITVKTKGGETKTILLHKEKQADEESMVKSYLLTGKHTLGYINLPGFYSREEDEEEDANYNGCANDVSKEILKLQKEGISGLILDLRNNGGGSMWEAIQLAGIFIDIGPVAAVKDNKQQVSFLKDPNRGTIYDGPMIVLINGASASASEFLSAALQDYNRALIVGDASYGKGTAQNVVPLPNGGNQEFVKVTEAKFYRVNGGTAQWSGVIPDIELPGLYSGDKFKEKENESALKPDRCKPGYYRPLPPLPVAELAAKSKNRISQNNYYNQITTFKNWYHQQAAGRQVMLEWQAYLKQYRSAEEMYKLLNESNIPQKNFVVNNIKFDQTRLNAAGKQEMAINAATLKNIQQDAVIAEVIDIFTDWQPK
jgi:carboxyl-terminal processing protease